MISQARIDRIKRSVSLSDYVQSCGIKLKSNGKEHMGLCPFHDDSNPSLAVNVETNLWFCFGCSRGGDVIKFVRLKENCSFEAAVERLDPQVKQLKAAAEQNPSRAPRSTAQVRLLTQAFDFYCRAFKASPAAHHYLKQRGIDLKKVSGRLHIGFSSGALIDKISIDADSSKGLEELGIINRNGREFFYHCLIFALVDSQGNIINLYGRHIKHHAHLYLPGERLGLFMPPKGSEWLILTEGIIDALSLQSCGFPNALALYGVNGFNEYHQTFLREERISKVLLALDGDQAGERAAEKLSGELQAMGIHSVKVALPPGEDINSLLTSQGEAALKSLIENGKAALFSPKTAAKENQLPALEESVQGALVYDFGERQYRILGLQLHGLDRLKVNIKVAQQERFHIDSFDLYSSRARSTFIEVSAKLLQVEVSILTTEIYRLIEMLEMKRLELIKNPPENEQVPEMSEEEQRAALEFLKSPDLLEQIQKDFDACGFIGEELPRLFGYLATLSRFLAKPLGVLIVSRSGAGKSSLQDAICDFVPPQSLQKYTRITGQSLFYKDQDALKHKVLAIAEEEGAADAIYSIRTLQSDQYLTVAVTISDPATGKKRTEEYAVEGPVVIILTTTRPEALDFETRNRFVTLTIDESRQQTRRILERQRAADSIEGLIRESKTSAIHSKHHHAQALLRPLKVVNPYHDDLSYPDNQLLMRREQQKYLTLIKTIAFLYQYQREVKSIQTPDGETIEYIEVQKEDIRLANRLAGEMLGHSLDELSPPTRNLLIATKEMVEKLAAEEQKSISEIRFSRRQLCEYTGWSYYQTQDHLKQLVELEYLLLYSGVERNRYLYELIWDGGGEDGGRFLSGLLNSSKLKK